MIFASRDLLKELERCECDAVEMSRCFIEQASRFDVYSFYCSNYPRSVGVQTVRPTLVFSGFGHFVP